MNLIPIANLLKGTRTRLTLTRHQRRQRLVQLRLSLRNLTLILSLQRVMNHTHTRPTLSPHHLPQLPVRHPQSLQSLTLIPSPQRLINLNLTHTHPILTLPHLLRPAPRLSSLQHLLVILSRQRLINHTHLTANLRHRLRQQCPHRQLLPVRLRHIRNHIILAVLP
jgi:hypothetical protein